MSIDVPRPIVQFVKTRENPKRYAHSVRVAETADTLALNHGEDRRKAFIAGFLHDLGRDIPEEELIPRARKYFPVFEWEEKRPVVVHGKAGAALAKDELGIENPEILEAVAYHTTGKPGMGNIAKIVFIADAVEPGRTHITKDLYNRMLTIPLDTAVFELLKRKLVYLEGKHTDVAENTIRLYNELAPREVDKIEA
mgnify:CR=1 FL=1